MSTERTFEERLFRARRAVSDPAHSTDHYVTYEHLARTSKQLGADVTLQALHESGRKSTLLMRQSIPDPTGHITRRHQR